MSDKKTIELREKDKIKRYKNLLLDEVDQRIDYLMGIVSNLLEIYKDAKRRPNLPLDVLVKIRKEFEAAYGTVNHEGEDLQMVVDKLGDNITIILENNDYDLIDE